MFSISTLVRRVAAVTTAATVLALGACADATPSTENPVLPGTPAIPVQYRGAAFIMDVNAVKKTVKISAPSTGISGPISAARLSAGVNSGPQYSLLGGDVIDLSSSNFQAGAVGASIPGKILVTFDLTINNRLSGIRLITPTFPTPPAGVTGVQAFPFEISVSTTAGGVTSGGNEVVITTPRFGAVVPSDNWNGNFHNFFNDVGCSVTANDCFRYESFGAIEPLGSSSTQQVGFVIDPTVGDFRVKVILAADLQNGVAPTPGSVTGTVTSPQLGAISAATINVTGGFTGTTSATGAYTIAGVATGSRTVSVTNLPSGCTAPANQNITVATSTASTVNFTVTCTVPTGSIAGAVTSSLGGGLAGVGVVATPTGGSATAAVLTAATTGAFSIANVPALVATGALTLTNLPANCTNPGPQAYSGLTTSGLTINRTITCTPAPTTYPLTAVWGAITNTGPTGRQVTLTLSIDMGSAPGSLAINGAAADDLAGITLNVAYNGLGLDWISRTGLTPNGEFDLNIVNEIGQGTAGAQVVGALASSAGQTITGSNPLVRLTFNIASGFSGTITPVLTVPEALATTSLINVTSSVTVSIPVLVIP